MKARLEAIMPGVSRPWVAIAAAVWLTAAVIVAFERPDAIDSGPYAAEVTLRTDVHEGRFGSWAMGSIPAGTVLVQFEEPVPAGRGDVLLVTGGLERTRGRAAGVRFGATLDVSDIVTIEPSGFWPHRAGRTMRRAVMARLAPLGDGRALLAGFLIGDTSRIADADVDAMRKSGLAHFVAVSGSNVALFLGLLAIAAGPLAIGPRRRAVVGLLGLPVYAAATRFEPSVMRASLMAGIALSGRLTGIVLEAWQLLSLAVMVLLALDPELTSNVGFQLSVAATAGVVVGARWPLKGGRLARALSITLGAQAAVSPLLVAHFGSVPLLSPLVNLVAAPIVALSTTLGAIGVACAPFLIGLAAWLSDLVLVLARAAAVWPQIDAVQFGIGGLGAVVAALRPEFRRVMVLPAAVLLSVAVVSPGERPPDASVVVLDVGQGDAILIHGGEGRFALVDGGPDGGALLDRLRAYGVTSLELVVLTHVHADHATGLSALVGAVDIGMVWSATEPHVTPASLLLEEAFETHGVRARAPRPGDTWALGGLSMSVVGPVRRYASPNDQSIVVMVASKSRTMLLSGDIETYAQADLRHLRADVLKVPHQGAGTSDPGWLRAVGASVGVISVGPNHFGHPKQWVIDLLVETGAEVRRTDHDGDVVVNLGQP